MKEGSTPHSQDVVYAPIMPYILCWAVIRIMCCEKAACFLILHIPARLERCRLQINMTPSERKQASIILLNAIIIRTFVFSLFCPSGRPEEISHVVAFRNQELSSTLRRELITIRQFLIHF